MKNKQTRLRVLCECGIMAALAVVLSYIRLFDGPLGGAVTPASMLPICLVAVKYGCKWGFSTAFCYSLFQVLQSSCFGWGLSVGTLIACILLDYVLAFTVLGISGIFAKHGKIGILAGMGLACVLRFLCHFVSGVVLWGNFEEFSLFGSSFVNRPVLYSLVYNGGFMLPETVILLTAAAILYSLQLKRFLHVSSSVKP